MKSKATVCYLTIIHRKRLIRFVEKAGFQTTLVPRKPYFEFEGNHYLVCEMISELKYKFKYGFVWGAVETIK
jgi:hypothetical protein